MNVDERRQRSHTGASMSAFLLWIQHLPVFTGIAESESVWAYPTVLMLHTVGLGWLVGLNTVVNLRLLGVAVALVDCDVDGTPDGVRRLKEKHR
jgi:hypothetical protein